MIIIKIMKNFVIILIIVNKYDYYIFCKMETDEILKSIERIALCIAVIIFLVLKFLKYLLSREHLKIKKSSSLFNSLESPSPK